MRVANILTNLKWKKAGQKQYQGKRQVIWIPIPPSKSSDIEKVQQPESQLPQDLSIPTAPLILNKESKNKLSLGEEEQERENKNDRVEVFQREAREAVAAIEQETYPLRASPIEPGSQSVNRAVVEQKKAIISSTDKQLN